MTAVAAHPTAVTIELLLQVFDVPVSFHRCLIPLCGGVTAALLLSQAIGTTQQLHPDCDGWFIKSREEWHAETGLSRWELETARRTLREAGFMQERRFGMPARLYYRVDADRLWQALQEAASRALAQMPDAAEQEAGACTAASTEETRLGDPVRDLGLLWPLLGRRIAFHRRLVDLTGSVKAAVLLSQMIYWTRHGRDIAVTDGWFHKTTAQWQLETGLTAREQAGAREVLYGLGLLDTRRRGAPAALYFRLVMPQLVTLLAGRLGSPVLALGRDDGVLVLELLGPPLAYHRTLAAIVRGVHAGLLLSRALYLTRYASARPAGGWFYAPRTRWTDDIGLGRWEQDGARRQLMHCGVWDECLKGMPPRLYARVRHSALLALLTAQSAAAKQPGHGPCGPRFPVGGNPALKTVAFPPSSRWDHHPQDSTKPATQFQQNQPPRFNKTSQLNVHRSTRCLVQTPLQPAPCKTDNGMDAASATGGGDWIMPQQLMPGERLAALALVSRCPHQAQALLDELAARLQRNAIHTSPIGYLRGLVQRAMAGAFVPELAAGIAAARQRQAEAATAREQREADVRRIAAEQATPEYQAQAAARRVQVRQMLDAMRARQQPRKAS